jgi:hypothetical protein
MTLAGGEVLGKNAVVASTKAVAVNTTIVAPMHKKREVTDKYNQLTLSSKSGYGLLLRAYNDGVAYRFFTQRPGHLTIMGEEATFNFAQNYPTLIPFMRDLRVPTDMYMSSFESLYSARKLADIKSDTLAFLPTLVALGATKKAVIVSRMWKTTPACLCGPTGRVRPACTTILLATRPPRRQAASTICNWWCRGAKTFWLRLAARACFRGGRWSLRRHRLLARGAPRHGPRQAHAAPRQRWWLGRPFLPRAVGRYWALGFGKQPALSLRLHMIA